MKDLDQDKDTLPATVPDQDQGKNQDELPDQEPDKDQPLDLNLPNVLHLLIIVLP